MTAENATWDGVLGTAGGAAFGQALQSYARKREVDDETLARACGMGVAELEEVYAGTLRVGVSALARMIQALRSRPIEFMQRTGMLSLQVYASGLDPLYFLPEGEIRYEARIYMREINPRHQVPEADMTKRNPTLEAVMQDGVLDALGRIEVELAYLLRTAVQQTGGSL
jgi:hypothetical protein